MVANHQCHLIEQLCLLIAQLSLLFCELIGLGHLSAKSTLHAIVDTKICIFFFFFLFVDDTIFLYQLKLIMDPSDFVT